MHYLILFICYLINISGGAAAGSGGGGGGGGLPLTATALTLHCIVHLNEFCGWSSHHL